MNTYISHRTALHRLDLVTHLSVGDPATEARLSGLTQALIAKGTSLLDAPHRARLAVLEMGVGRQATLLSYIDTFYLVALLCGLCIPLVIAAGRPPPARRSIGRGRGRSALTASENSTRIQ